MAAKRYGPIAPIKRVSRNMAAGYYRPVATIKRVS